MNEMQLTRQMRFRDKSYLLGVAAAAAGRAAAPRRGGRVLRRGPAGSLGRGPVAEDAARQPVAGRGGGQGRGGRGRCGRDRVVAAGRCDVGDPGPEGRVPGRGVEDAVHGGGGWGVLLDLHLRGVIITVLLLSLYLRQLDLLPGLGDGGAQVDGLGGCRCAGYLAGVLWRSEGIPVLRLPKVSSLRVGAPVVTGDGWEGEEGLRGGRCEATVRGFVGEEARVCQDAVGELERRGGAQTLLAQGLRAQVGPAEVVRPALALRALRSLRHLRSSEGTFRGQTKKRPPPKKLNRVSCSGCASDSGLRTN